MASKEYRDANKEKIKESGKQYYLKNKERIRKQSRQYYLDNKEAWLIKTRDNELKRLFGITIEQKQQIEKEQNYLCAICGKEEKSIDSRTGKKKRLSVDHCHTTGKLRQLLCMKCNTSFEHYLNYKSSFESYFERHK